MTTKKLLAALDLVRKGDMAGALSTVDTIDISFVRRRLRHYQTQPDHREPAHRLAEVVEARREAARASRTRPAPPAAAVFNAPLAASTVAAAPTGSIDFAHPEAFLAWASADWQRVPTLDLDRLQHVDVWALAALDALRLAGRGRRPPMSIGQQSGAARFAHALGLSELGEGRPPTTHETERTVPLTRVSSVAEIEPAAERIAKLVITDPTSDVRLAIRYVLVELLRNVLQHSGDALGAVVAAQAMGPIQRRSRPMIQLAVADAGIGIPRHLQRKHPHLTDYRQALERALLPHISGTFEEGLSGSFENAGLGLYVISEMARQTKGNLLIATTGASLVLQASDSAAHPRFLHPEGIGFPGTLVAFEIPTDGVQDYYALMKSILDKTRDRTPKRASDRWLSFEPAPHTAHRIALASIRENTPEALALATKEIDPAIVAREPVELDFRDIDLCTQSWLHALLYESIRLAWARRVPIHIVNADPAVREGLRFLEAYALGG